MKSRIVQGSTIFDLLVGEWDELSGRSITDTPFQTLAYQRAWWQHLGIGELFSVVVADEQGQLQGLACFYLLDGGLYWNGSMQESDYLDLLAPAGLAANVWATVWDTLASPDFPAWHTLDLCNVPAGSPTRTILPQLLSGRDNLQLTTEIQEVCPIIPLPNNFEHYLESLDKKQRHELRRKLRRAEAEDVQVVMARPGDNLPQLVNDFLELLQKSTPEKNQWLNDGRRALFQDTAAAAMAAGTLQLLFLEVEGQKAAALFNFDYKGRIWVYNSGLDPAAFGYLSTGVILTAKAIEQAIDSGRDQFDFLRGNEEYKYRFGATDTTIHRLLIKKST